MSLRGRIPLASVAFMGGAFVLGATIWIAGALGEGEPAEVPPPEDQATPRGEGTWLPGAPIDTPPAQASPVFNTAPAGEEDQWKAVADWARLACHFDGGAPDDQPAAMFKTTAGEIRRRNADINPDGTTLGSNWRNQDTVFLVAYRGDFPHRPGPPLPDDSTPPPIPNGNMCLYIGNGRADDWDNSSVGVWTTDRTPDNVEGFFR